VSKHLRKAEKLYDIFHQFEPDKVGEFRRGFQIPREAFYVGEAKTMYYASDKLNPTTGEDEGWIQYYHPHEGGVRMYLADDPGHGIHGQWRKIPKWIWGVDALTRLGDCEGFDYEDFDGQLRKLEGVDPLPEWYAIPSGKALLVVQSKSKVLAVLWGGSLNVEWRGVVG
jgi:hypothetical protein